MESENAFKNFDDLVFENRNKKYGAYAIRRSYNDNVSKAVTFALVASGLIILISFRSAEKNDSGVIASIPNPVTWDNVTPTIIPVTPQKKIVSVRSVSNNVAPVVTTATVVDVPIENNNTVTSNGNETGSSDILPTEGAVGIEPVTEVITIVKEPTVFNHVEIMPQYVGGYKEMTKFIQRTFHYPAIARRMNTEGTVYVSFVVDALGNVINVKVEKGISKECDEEAKHIIASMPQWLAGKQGDIPVSVRQYLPIKFQLSFD